MLNLILKWITMMRNRDAGGKIHSFLNCVFADSYITMLTPKPIFKWVLRDAQVNQPVTRTFSAWSAMTDQPWNYPISCQVYKYLSGPKGMHFYVMTLSKIARIKKPLIGHPFITHFYCTSVSCALISLDITHVRSYVCPHAHNCFIILHVVHSNPVDIA